MLDLFNIPTPQTANYQEFYGSGGTAAEVARTWVKPRGVSMVRFLLIGAGGGGGPGLSTNGGGGGGSGAVTSWIGPAIFVPDILNIGVSAGGESGSTGNPSTVYYVAKSSYLLLSANNGGQGNTSITGGDGGSAMPANYFTASGIFTSIAGQGGTNGSASGGGTNQTASATTFLSGGSGGSGGSGSTGGSVTPNYGYRVLPAATAGGTVAGDNGYFITQPILVGCGGAGGTTSTTVGTAGGIGGIGCGGGGSGEDANTGGRGGSGAVFVWAW